MARFTATELARLAEERAAQCTPEENHTRQKNGRRTNVAIVFQEEDAAMFLFGADNHGEKSQPQTRDTFAYA